MIYQNKCIPYTKSHTQNLQCIRKIVINVKHIFFYIEICDLESFRSNLVLIWGKLLVPLIPKIGWDWFFDFSVIVWAFKTRIWQKNTKTEANLIPIALSEFFFQQIYRKFEKCGIKIPKIVPSYLGKLSSFIVEILV